MQKFAEIRKLDRASLVRDFNLFPCPANLLVFERKYGDALSFEDINGFKMRKRRRTRNTNTTTTSDGATTMAVTEYGGMSEAGVSTL